MTKELAKNLIGSVAAACTTIAYFPQLLHVWQRKCARDVSLRMFVIMCIGVTFWLVYGVMYDSWPMIIANSLTLLQALIILTLKIRYDRLDAERIANAGKVTA